MHKLPVIFQCENNDYAISVPMSKQMAVKSVADRGAAYGIPGVKVDGTDVLATYAATREAVARARAGEGPTLIEARTFRFFGHVFGDADAYMAQGEKEAAMARDPVPRFRSWLIEGGVPEGDLATLEAAIDHEIDEAVAFALDSPVPDLAELQRDVLAEEIAA